MKLLGFDYLFFNFESKINQIQVWKFSLFL